MRAGPLAVAAAALVLGACSAGEGNDSATPAPGPTTTLSSTTTTTPAPAPTAVPTTDAASVTLRVRGLTLPDVRTGGSGLRVLVRAASPRLTVRRSGVGAPVRACPVAGTAAADERECVDLAPQTTVEITSAGGVELRAGTVAAAVDEVTVTYVATSRSMTLVTPARPAGACATRPCEATYSLGPPRPGAFVLDGRGGGGRPRLVLSATGPGGSTISNRMLATVEGGGSLSIRATLEAGSEAWLLHHEEGDGPIAPVTAEILWP